MKALRTMPKGELLRGMNLCLRNARSLLREARLLAQAGARKRAVALAVLAMEEAGKVVLLTLGSHSDRAAASNQTLKDLGKVFRSHNTKVALVAERSWKNVLYVRRRKHVNPPASSIRRMIGDYKRVLDLLGATGAEDEAALKLRAMYVDIDNARGRFRAPVEVSSADCSALLRIARSGTRDAERLRNTFRRAGTDRLTEDIMGLMMKSSDLQALLAQLSSTSTAAS